MKVKAIRMGYRDHVRIRPGTVFELPDKEIKLSKDGEIVSPKWVVPAGKAVAPKRNIPGQKLARAPKDSTVKGPPTETVDGDKPSATGEREVL